jgi:hypothetical protein
MRTTFSPYNNKKDLNSQRKLSTSLKPPIMRYLWYTSIILAFVAATSAIDIHFFFNRRPDLTCKGHSLVCTDAKPGVRTLPTLYLHAHFFSQVCCPVPQYAEPQTLRPLQAGFYSVRKEWEIDAAIFRNYNYQCTWPPHFDNPLTGRENYCVLLGHMPLSSASYVFRKDHEGLIVGRGAEKECQRVDTFVHEDGQRYDIRGVEEEQIGELVALAVGGVSSVDLPEMFRALAMSG